MPGAPRDLSLPLDRATTLDTFHERLLEVISATGLSQTAFARKVGMDRSTLSQILSRNGNRLPRLETLVQIATSEQISIDWLVGISQEGKLGADILDQSIRIQSDERAQADEQLGEWHLQAVGYKIRYVPLNIPDLLKIPEVIDYEYRLAEHSTPEQQRQKRAVRLATQRRPESDMEVCTPIQAVEVFARGEGRWWNLETKVRKAQLVHMAQLCEDLYPTFRWFMFDLANRFSASMTIFGPQRVVVFLGQRYLALTSTEMIRNLTGHFDDLIRAATVQPTEVPERLRGLAKTLK